MYNRMHKYSLMAYFFTKLFYQIIKYVVTANNNNITLY